MGREYTRNISVIGAGETPLGLLFADDFEHLLKCKKLQGEGDAIFELDPSIALRGNQSLRMMTRTTDAAEGDYIAALYNLFMIPSRRIAAIFHFRLPSLTTPEYVQFQIKDYDGVNYHSASIFFYPNTPVWTYLNIGGTETAIPDSATKLYADTWHRLTLYLDLANDLYISAYINSFLLSISNLSINVDTSEYGPFTQLTIKTETAGANPVDINIDHISLLEA
ncbi:hypothetical protein ES708_10864 [subsurface metagenome]